MNTRFLEELRQKVMQNLESKPVKSNVGKVMSSSDGIITITGLPSVSINECLEFEDGRKAIVWKVISYNECVALLIGSNVFASAGEVVKQTKESLKVPVGKSLLGRVVDAIGNPIDGKGPLVNVEYTPCKADAAPINTRKSISEPYHTGIKGVDMLIPIGRGQRELIIGDRNTGKTTLALDSLIHQHKIQSGVIGIYVAIGQRMSAVSRLVDTLEKTGALANCIVVVASASDTAMMQVLAPLTGCTMGEYFMNNNEHAVIVYDDLWKHAIAYRQISLLLRRSPGREAFAGDTFFQHSSLLERAANIQNGGSLTALPIVETQAGDISAYIPTNVISITDGQIFLDSAEFQSGVKPAINFGLSVSRIGSAGQWKATTKIAGPTKLYLAQWRELKEFTKGGEVSESNAKRLEHGQRLSDLFLQCAHETVSAEAQCALFEAFNLGAFDSEVKKSSKEFVEVLTTHGLELLQTIKNEKALGEDAKRLLNEIIELYHAKKIQENK